MRRFQWNVARELSIITGKAVNPDRIYPLADFRSGEHGYSPTRGFSEDFDLAEELRTHDAHDPATDAFTKVMCHLTDALGNAIKVEKTFSDRSTYTRDRNMNLTGQTRIIMTFLLGGNAHGGNEAVSR